ncbi:MAG: substrate-binding domain-containing protein [Spirochaetales bacterium]|nr:substrate-binding domain-containing protein [Spirochaetales bacterium]
MTQASFSQRLLIGFAIDWSANPYHLSLINGSTKAAQHFDANQIIYVGGTLHSPIHHEKICNIIYNYINKSMLDGLIISAACIKRYVGSDELSGFIKQFQPLPMVTITEKVDNIPCIRTDNSKGLRELLLHLIHDHKYKNIGFIKGMEGNPDAIERFQVFKNTLKEEGIPVNPDIILNGSFTFESGMEAVLELMNHRMGPCDVLVAANDDMARGAISVLQNRGIHVPEEIAVVGYDNQDLCEYLSIPLTTVTQPVFDQGWKAMELLISIIKGESQNKDITLSTSMVRRQSCGCTSTANKKFFSYNKEINLKEDSFTDALLIEKTLVDIYQEFHIESARERHQIHNIYKALIISLKTEDQFPFFKEMNHILNTPLTFIHKEYSFNKIFLRIRESILNDISSYKDRAFVEYLFAQVGMQFAERFERDLKYTQVLEEREIHSLRVRLENLVSILDMNNLADELAEKLPPIGIKGCYLSLYENDNAGNYPVISRLVFAFNEKGRIPIQNEGELFPSQNLCPDNLLPWHRQFSISVEDLFFGQTQLGFCLFEFEKQRQSLWETARKMFIIVGLKAAMYVQKVKLDTQKYEDKVNTRTEALSRANELLTRLYEDRKHAEEEVRRLNEDLELRVRDRTAQLENAYNRLQETLNELTETQSKLVQSEKMAALGGLVAGVAHEINTPIGIGVTAASHLGRETQELMKLFSDNSLKKSDLENYVTIANEASAMVLSNLQRAHELIKSFKKIAVDQSSEEKRKFNVKTYLKEILISLKPKLKKTTHTIKIQCSDDLEICSYPGTFSQIITNFIINSLIHGFDESVSGKITIKCAIYKNNFILRYFDNGKGIVKEYVNRIFEPFFTTNRIGGGTGLGLNLVYNIVTQTLNGTIRVSSRPGYGTLFKITIPLKEVSS